MQKDELGLGVDALLMDEQQQGEQEAGVVVGETGFEG